MVAHPGWLHQVATFGASVPEEQGLQIVILLVDVGESEAGNLDAKADVDWIEALVLEEGLLS